MKIFTGAGAIMPRARQYDQILSAAVVKKCTSNMAKFNRYE